MSEPQQPAEDPVLITDAAVSYDEELRIRKHRYKIMMGMRIPLMVLAAFCYQIAVAGGRPAGAVDPAALDRGAGGQRPAAEEGRTGPTATRATAGSSNSATIR